MGFSGSSILAGADGSPEEERRQRPPVALGQVGEGRHHALPLRDDLLDVLLRQPRSEVHERRNVLGGRAATVDPVAGGAVLPVELPARALVVRPGHLHHREDPRHLVGVDVELPGLGVEGRPAPLCSPVEAGEDHGPFLARGDEAATRAHLAEALQDRLVGGRRDVRRIGFGEELSREGRRLHRDGLGGPGRLPHQVGRRRRDLLDGEERLARLAIEEEDEARLRGLGDGVDLPSLVVDGHEDRSGGGIPVPDVVVGHLVVPDALPRRRVEGEDAVREEVLPHAIAPPEIERGRAHGKEHEAARPGPR